MVRVNGEVEGAATFASNKDLRDSLSDFGH